MLNCANYHQEGRARHSGHEQKYLTKSALYATVCFERAVMIWILQKPVSSIMILIKHLRLMDDVLMVKCFEDNPECTELLLQLIIKEPLKKAHIKRHEGKGRRSRPEFSQFLRPNAGFCPVFLRLSHKKGAKAPVMLPAVFARPSPGSRGLRRQT